MSSEQQQESAASAAQGGDSDNSSTHTKGHIKIDVDDVIQFTKRVQAHVRQIVNKRTGWAPLMYSFLAAGALLLIIRQSQIIQTSTETSFFYDVNHLKEMHRSSCKTRKWRKRLNENATLFQRPPTPLCASIAHGSLTTSSLWKAGVSAILKGSKHPLDKNSIHQEWQQALLDLVGPNILAKSLRNLPAMQDIERIVKMIDTRRDAMHRKFALKEKVDFTKAPMIHVAVFGGSVTEGSGCDELSDEVWDYLPKSFNQRKDEAIRGRDCSWPYRLQMLADAFLGQWVVRVHNLAASGTNSQLTATTLEYQLYQEQVLLDRGGADIVINGYAVDDNLSNLPNSTANSIHYDNSLERVQTFVTKALESRPCREGERPVVVFLDEVLGNHNADIILGDDIRNDAIRFVSELYNLLYVSSSLPIKHLVLANEKETVFSPSWWTAGGNRVMNGNFAMPGHQYAAYTMAYAMLDSLVSYCSAEEFGRHKLTVKQKSLAAESTLLMQKLPYPPRIDSDKSKLSTITEKWSDHADMTLLQEKQYCENANAKAAPCSFAFVSTPTGTVRTTKEMEAYINRFIVNKNADNTGWIGRSGMQNQLGLVASKPGASILLTLPNIQNPMQKIIVQYLKSLGINWSGSQAEFDLRIYDGKASTLDTEPVYRKTFVLKGEGEKQSTSTVSLQEIVDLRDNTAQIGQTVTLRITLTGGSEFIINGLMLCSR